MGCFTSSQKNGYAAVAHLPVCPWDVFLPLSVLGRLQLLIYLYVHGMFFSLSLQCVGCSCSFTCVSIGCVSSSQCNAKAAVAHLPVCPWDVFLPLIAMGRLQLFIYLCVHEMCFFLSMQWVGCSCSFTCVSMGCFFLPLNTMGRLQLLIYHCVHGMFFFLSVQWVGCSCSFTCVSMGSFSPSHCDG